MTAQSKIEWTDATWNPVRGCTRVSEGCRNCYAEVMAARFSDPGQWGHGFARRVTLPDGSTDHRWTGRVELIERQLPLPLRWKKPRKIFVNSTSDVFHENLSDADIDRIFAVMALAPQHTFQILTKRPKRMHSWFDYFNGAGIPRERVIEQMYKFGAHFAAIPWPLPNVWLGTSIEDQDTANDRIPHLLATPAAIRFVSAEPLLRSVLLPPEFLVLGNRAMVIAGGESGQHARLTHPDLLRWLRDQCADAGVPFFFKQWGEWVADASIVTAKGASFEYFNGLWFQRVGKKAAGRMLDGREHNDFPRQA